MKSHVNIPVFIPHLGCPHTCVFCNQRKISGRQTADFSSVEREIEEALSTVGVEQTVQIAYFGGSFTGIPRDDMIYLLGLAKKYIDAGRVESIRLSTRPDYIDRETLNILARYGVKTIELGLQSMSDEVLSATERGHDSLCAERACKLVRDGGFELIGQMMTGLPRSSYNDDVYTARRVAELCDGARIYPTVVFYGTKLCDMAQSGEYDMPETEELIRRTVGALREFVRAGIPVIRIGLQSSDGVTDGDGVYSKTYFPAMGEICYSRLYREFIDENMPRGARDVEVLVGERCVSKAVGQRGENRDFLMKKHKLHSMKITGDASLSEFEIKIHELENKT